MKALILNLTAWSLLLIMDGMAKYLSYEMHFIQIVWGRYFFMILISLPLTYFFFKKYIRWPRSINLQLARSIFHIEREKFILVAHNIFIVRGQHQEKINISGRFQNSSNSLFHGLYRRGFISTSTVVASLSAIHQAGGFDTSLQVGQDFDLWLKMLGSQDSQFFIFDEYLAKYYVREKSITRRADSRLSCTIKIAQRHAPLLRQHNGSPIISLWFRLVAVHYEAIRAHICSKKYNAAFRVLLKLPVVFIMETMRLVKTPH